LRVPRFQLDFERASGLGEHIAANRQAVRGDFKRQRDHNRLGPLGKLFENLVLRAREVGKAVDQHDLQVFQGALLSRLQQGASRPVAAFGVEKPMIDEQFLIILVQAQQLAIFGRHPTRLASLGEFFRPNLQPL